MRNIDIQELSIGTKVYWHDPAGETSGIYEILIMPDINELAFTNHGTSAIMGAVPCR